MEFDEYIGIDWSGARSPQQLYSIMLVMAQQATVLEG